MTSPAGSALDRRRTEIEAAMGSQPLHPDTTVTSVAESGFAGLRIDPVQFPGGPTLIHLHGGGFRLGSAAAWAPFLSHVAVHTRSRVLAVDYPLAPEHPFPAAARTCHAAAEWVAATSGSFVLCGDSAGAGLAAATALSLRAEIRSLHWATMLLSPWVDLRVVNDSYTECGPTDSLFSAQDAREAATGYSAGQDVANPALSPALGDWTGQPPVLIETSSTEVLRDDARQLAARLLASGVTVWFREVLDQPHDWHITGPQSHTVRSSLELMHDFVDMTSMRESVRA